MDNSDLDFAIFNDRDICWLYELAAATGMSRDFLRGLVETGDLDAIDMAATGSKRRKLAVHRVAWAGFIKRRKTVGTVKEAPSVPRRRFKQQAPKDFLSRGKRKK